MGKGRKKLPKFPAGPSDVKTPKYGGDPTNSDKETPCWHIGHVDLEGPWSWRAAAPWDLLATIHAKLANFETMTWAEILKATGGRKQGNNSHNVSLNQICKKARDRLIELGHKDIAEIFSLRLAGTQRVWGIKTGRILKVIWWDPEHNVYEST